jgi:hypothetical protein
MVRAPPVAVLVIITLALATTAPEASVTVPRILPCEVWATMPAAQVNPISATIAHRMNLLIGILLETFMIEY